MSLFTGENINISYENFQLSAKKVTLSAGNIVWLQGVNGAGKSTFLKMISGGLPALTGRLLFENFTLRENPIGYKQNIVYVDSVCNVYSYFTIQEALTFCAQLYPNWSTAEAAEWLKVLELDPLIKIKHLSAGMAAKVNFIIAASANVKIMLIDELLSPLDKKGREIIVQHLVNYANRGNAVVYCSHHSDWLTASANVFWEISNNVLVESFAGTEELIA